MNFECFKRQGVGRTQNQNRLDNMLKIEGNEYGVGQRTMSMKYYYNQRLWDLGQNTAIETKF